MENRTRPAVLLLGGNLGDRAAALLQAERLIEARIGPVVLRSSLYESSPWGDAVQPDFLNRALVVHTPMPVETLLDALQAIEKEIGRIPSGMWRPRLIDIDILFYGNMIRVSGRLTIPHPHLCERKFALVPLAEIIPQFIHPQFNRSILALLRDCRDKGEVSRIVLPQQGFAEA